MRKHLSAFVYCAMAVLALSSCKREPVATVNPTYDADANTVKADFVLNLSTPATNDASTKTTPEFAQAGDNPTFLGMEAVHLLAYNLGEKNFYYMPSERDAEGNVVKFPATRDFDLGNLMNAGDVTSSSSSRSVSLALPLNTNAMVLYGKAKKDASNDLQGAVTTTGDVNDISTIQFSLVSRLTSQDAFDGAAFLFTRCLNNLVSAGLVKETSFWNNPTGSVDRSYRFWWPIDANTPTDTAGVVNGATRSVDRATTYTFHRGQISWKQFGQMYDYAYKKGLDPSGIPEPDMDLSPLGESLGEAYSVLTTIVSRDQYKELRAGSAASLIRTMDDLYTVLLRIANTDPTGWEEHVAKLMAQEIIRRMDQMFLYQSGVLYFMPKKNGDVYDVTSVDLTRFLTVAELAGGPSDWAANKSKIDLFDESFFAIGDNPGFPVNIGLPYGAACLGCTVVNDIDAAKKSVDRFSYVTDIPAYGMGEATFPIANYRYPPELMYYGNSPIRVSNNAVETFPASVSAWDSESQWNDWEEGKVVSTTRSVAMKNHINYGTALLKTNVRYATGVTKLYDNNSYIHDGEADNEIEVNTRAISGGFEVTGIIIGGQPNTVCWDYTRAADDINVVWKWDEEQQLYTDDQGGAILFNNNKFDKMIYDKVIRDNDYIIGRQNDPIYTFAWDNYDATLAADKQSDVYVAVEILNNTGKDFWGELNLVRNGGTFYLIGKLDMKTARKPDGFNLAGMSNYNYPPYKTQDGSTVDAPRVFMQNYVTTADIILGKDALKHAYVTMPDLRSSQITLGLVIDMSWKSGLEFNVNIGTE